MLYETEGLVNAPYKCVFSDYLPQLYKHIHITVEKNRIWISSQIQTIDLIALVSIFYKMVNSF